MTPGGTKHQRVNLQDLKNLDFITACDKHKTKQLGEESKESNSVFPLMGL